MSRITIRDVGIVLIAVWVAGCTPSEPQTAATLELEPAVTLSPVPEDTALSPTHTPTPDEPTLPPEPEPILEPTGPAPTIDPGAGLDIAFIHMVDRSLGWAIGGANGARSAILHTTDGARSFRDVTPPIGAAGSQGAIWAVGEFLDAQTAWVLYFPAILEPGPPGATYMTIWHTENAGLGWEQSEVVSTSVLGTQDFPPRIAFINAYEGWFMARNGGAGMHRYPVSVFRTADGGQGWSPLIEALGGSELQSCRKTGWAFGDSQFGLSTIDNCPVNGPAIEMTKDGGESWERAILPPPELDPDTVTEAYCITGSPQFITSARALLTASCTAYQDAEVQRELLYRSDDQGQSWSVMDYPGGAVLFLDENQGFAFNRTIHWTSDGGMTWEEQKQVNWDGQFSFADAEYGWAVAREGEEQALVMTEDGGERWVIIRPILLP